MKRKVAVAFLAAAVLLGCAACQPTPETAVVVNKNDPQPAQTGKESTPPFSAPERCTDSYDYYDGKLTVEVDAEVAVPAAETYYTYKVMPVLYTQAQAETMVRVFFGDAEIEAYGQQWTKSRLEDFLIGFKAQYAQGNSPGMTEQEYKESVRILEEKIAKAPETVVAQNPAEQIQGFSASGRISLQADMGKAQKAALKITNADEGYGSYAGYTNNDGVGYTSVAAGGVGISLKLSEDEARAQAESLLGLLGIEGMDAQAVKRGFAYGQEGDAVLNLPQCYLIYFTRTVQGVPATFEDSEGDAYDSDDFDRVWRYERIVVGVDDGGIVQFTWQGNAGITRTQEAALLGFDEIMARFKENMGVRYAYHEGEGRASSAYRVTRITLGLSRIKTVDGYWLVPVWDFFGTVSTMTTEGENQVTVLDGTGDGQVIRSFLTINALDGSVIDRSIGY